MENQFRSAIEIKIFDIETQIRKRIEHPMIPNLMGDFGGIVLFYFYLYKQTKLESYHDIAFSCLENSIDQINETKFGGLSAGLTGICWLLNICYEENFIDDDVDEILAGADATIIEWATKEFLRNNFDFLHGGIGAYVYLLNRYKHQKIDVLEIEKLTEIVLSGALRKNGNLWWGKYDFNNKTYLPDEYNLGVSHGNISILYAVALANNLGICKDKTYAVLNEALNTLNKFIDEPMENGYYFPYSINLTNEKKNAQSRLAWCYCDLGNAAILRNISELMGMSTLMLKANAIAQQTLSVLQENDGTSDSSLCHGILGNANIYNILSVKLKDESFQKKAMELVELYCAGNFPSAEKHNLIDRKGIYQLDYGLLEGISGLGLSLLSYLSDEQPKWNRFFLITI